MTKAVLRDMIVWQVQSLLPEVTDWNTMLRVLRIAGQGVNPAHLQGVATDPVEYYLRLGLEHYGERTKLYYGEIEIQWLASDHALFYREHGVLEPHLVYWRANDQTEYKLLRKIFRYPVRQSTNLEQGEPDSWLLQGMQITLVPRPTGGYVLVEGVLAPYFEGAAQTIVGVNAVDLPYIARYIASHFIEGSFPQHALSWRAEAEQMYLRRLKDTRWFQHRQRRGIRYGRR